MTCPSRTLSKQFWETVDNHCAMYLDHMFQLVGLDEFPFCILLENVLLFCYRNFQKHANSAQVNSYYEICFFAANNHLRGLLRNRSSLQPGQKLTLVSCDW